MPADAYRRWGKRALDAALAGAGLVVLSPALALIALAVRLSDGGPALFRQTRIGRGFRPFAMLKFRSMRPGPGGPKVTRGADPRITPLGRFLRRTKLDELPQLFNVLRGDMSLVGPRPEVPEYVERFRARYEAVLTVRPGVTDWAAVAFRDEESLLDGFDDAERGYLTSVLPRKLELYERYVASVSLSGDLLILLATAARLLGAEKMLARPLLGRRTARGIMPPMPTPKRRVIVMALDVLAVLAAYALAFLLRYDLRPGRADVARLLATAPYAIFPYLATSYYFGVNRGLRFCNSLGDVFDIVKAAVSAAALEAVLVLAARDPAFPKSVLLSFPIFTVFCVALVHGCARGLSHYLYVHLLGGGRRRDVVIVGCGDLAELVYENMRTDRSIDYRVAAFFDWDGSRFGLRLHGAKVVGPGRLEELLRRRAVDELVVAVARHNRGRALEAVADALKPLERRPPVLVAPTVDEMLAASKRAQPRKVRPEDLLNRRVISLDAARIGRSLAGRVVLISGAGGTIGGELARQVARHGPRRLILLENNATALFFAEAELRDRHPEVDVVATLGDVRDRALLARLFRDERPSAVFHAAAHKHVHQLETNVAEGISNNLLGTYQLASAADRAGVETFILISTDKAVRPSCVMGATKRAAEIVVSNFARSSRTRFASVRFGNVLGSSGSVLKIFEQQIEKGQPLTLTHPDAMRYFMTVEEAVGLVLQASTLAKGGEVFVLNMGEQIRIMEIARRLIWLSGLEPERDVPIRVIGLRPGEKLAEEIVEDPLGQEPSEHPDIMVLRSENSQVEQLTERLLKIEMLATAAEKDAMIRALAQLVPTFTAAPGHDGVRVSPVDDHPHDESAN